MSVVAATLRDLDDIRKRSVVLAESALAATALALAREMDDVASEEECEECGHVQSWTTGRNSATSKSMCAKALVDTMDRLRELAPPRKESDGVNDLERKRAERRDAARSAGA